MLVPLRASNDTPSKLPCWVVGVSSSYLDEDGIVREQELADESKE
jgi:hypothetical protein